MVDLIIECTSLEDYASIQSEIETSRASLFGLGLVILELATLVEEDSWYTEDMQLRKDIISVKFSMLREHYSPRLTRIVELLLSPATVRPDLEGMIKLTADEREESRHF